jgi:hypothetical protein
MIPKIAAITILDQQAHDAGMTHKVISKTEGVPSGYYFNQGVKMFAELDLQLNIRNVGYVFRLDDYNESKIEVIELGETK